MTKVKEDYLIKILDHETGESDVHIRNIGPTDHVSVCGMDGGLADTSQEVLPLRREDKMSCSQCKVFYQNREGLNIPEGWLL